MGSSLSEEQRKHVDELGYLLKQTHNEVSQCSLIRLGLLEGIKNGYTMIPEDWKQVFRMILTSMQYVVWENEYLRHAQAAALGGGGAYMVEQLFGSGQFAAVPAQTVLPQTLAVVSECAYRAFLKVPQAGEPRANFSNIWQGANEPYADFVERLSKAIRQQFDHQEAAGELLHQLAIENANADCKRALQPLKATEHYTLADMLQICQDIGSQTIQDAFVGSSHSEGAALLVIVLSVANGAFSKGLLFHAFYFTKLPF
ncbi:hypothetical protein E2320_000200 [Naja naja]|nr:hypothetical protein E2320_000200 [Naja naja]